MSDLISRQNALDALKEYEVVESDNFTKTDPISMMTVATIANCIEVIWELPIAEHQQKKGEWTGDCCSCCGVSKYNYIKMVDDECGPFGTWNFCPNCGADMRGDHE